jgi:hypothetical protein
LLSALKQVRQPAARDVFGYATAVVDYVDAQVIVDFDGHGKLGGIGVPHGVADRLTDNGFRMVSQACVNHRQWSDELRRNVQRSVRKLADCFV